MLPPEEMEGSSLDDSLQASPRRSKIQIASGEVPLKDVTPGAPTINCSPSVTTAEPKSPVLSGDSRVSNTTSPEATDARSKTHPVPHADRQLLNPIRLCIVSILCNPPTNQNYMGPADRSEDPVSRAILMISSHRMPLHPTLAFKYARSWTAGQEEVRKSAAGSATKIVNPFRIPGCRKRHR